MENIRKILNFNTEWGFQIGDTYAADMDFDDSSFQEVTIPHTMRLEKKHAGDVSAVFRGIGWYRRYFTLRPEFQNKHICIEFDGVMMDCDIFLNGEKIYTHSGGYMGFSVDVSNKIKFSEKNVLAVRVSNLDNPDTPPGKPLSQLDFHYYGGIYRNVRIVISENIFITNPLAANETAGGGVFITYPYVSHHKAELNIKTHIANYSQASSDITLKTYIKDANGNCVAEAESEQTVAANNAQTFEQTAVVTSPFLWHPDTPNLYTAESVVFADEKPVDFVSTVIGIRRIEMRPDGCYINGAKTYIRGANRHQCYAFIGDAAPDSMQVRDALQMKENGFNGVRAAHYPQSPAFLDACDRIGLLVIECQPGWQQFTPSDTFYERTLRDIREMIRRDRNHPCIFLWETSLNETHYTKEWAEDAVKTAHEEYPNDQMFTAADYGLQGDVYDVNYKVIDGDTDYNPQKTAFTREWGDMGGYCQFFRKDGEYLMRWQTQTHQRFLNGGGYPDWGGLDQGDRLAGYFMWSWNDYARGYAKNTLASGCVETDRSEKYLAHWLRSMLPGDKNPMVFIASRYTIFSGRAIYVYSNCDEVELFQNSALVGKLSRTDKGCGTALQTDARSTLKERFLRKNYVADVPYIVNKGGSPIFRFYLKRPLWGKITAKGYMDGKVVAAHTVKAPHIAKKIVIEPQLRNIQPVADGSDIFPVYFKITDKNETLKTRYHGKVHITVSGDGALVGQGVDRIAVAHQRPDAGVAFAFVRTSKKAGEITIKAEAPGLHPASLTVKTVPYTGEYVETIGMKHWSGENQAEQAAASAGRLKIHKAKIGKRDIKSITASFPNVPERGTDKLFDGVTLVGTGWLSASDSLPQMLTIQLKKPHKLTASTLFWEKDSNWYTYDLEVSADGVNWEKVFEDKTVGGQAKQAEPFPHVCTDVCYVKVTIKDVVSGGGQTRIGLAEIALYKD